MQLEVVTLIKARPFISTSNILEEIPPEEQVSICDNLIATLDRDLTDHKLAVLDKSLPLHTDQQKLDFALNKMTEKTRVTAAQEVKALDVGGGLGAALTDFLPP
uniref:Uncharacterized protein n=1 Tax=Romanomermis culicivorax TaxID=13658 RepID=A0A915IRF2_ROMCU